MAHHRDAGLDDRLHAREHRAGALELDRVRARLFDEADRVLDGLLVGDLERAERHVADDHRMPSRARDGASEEQHLVHRHRDRRPFVAEHHHGGRVPDEDDVDARVFCEPRAGRVVGGHHHDLLAATLLLPELGQRQLPLGRCAHLTSPFLARPSQDESWHGISRTTLSIKRVLPTRTAAASTFWPSSSATSR